MRRPPRLLNPLLLLLLLLLPWLTSPREHRDKKREKPFGPRKRRALSRRPGDRVARARSVDITHPLSAAPSPFPPWLPLGDRRCVIGARLRDASRRPLLLLLLSQGGHHGAFLLLRRLLPPRGRGALGFLFLLLLAGSGPGRRPARVLGRWSSTLTPGKKEEKEEEAGPELPVVRVPFAWRRRRLEEEEEQQRQKSQARRKGRGSSSAEIPTTGRLLLLSRRRELSQALRHTVGRWEKPPLASGGWKHRRSRGDYFQLQRTSRGSQAGHDPSSSSSSSSDPDDDNASSSSSSSSSSFLSLGVEPRLCSALQEALGIRRPSAVQERLIPPLLAGSNALCAGQTGSGKTLAYLLPLLQRLLQSRGLPGALGSADSPRAVVVLPSRELAGQVTSVARRLCALLGLQVREIEGGRGLGSVRQKIRSGPTDLLVSTPGILSRALKNQVLTLEKVHCLVLDEVDTLLDPSFVDLVEHVLQHTPLSTSSKEVADIWDPKTQLVAVGATLPKGLQEMLSKAADTRSFRVLTCSNLHRLQPHVEQKFVRVKGSEKVTELVQLIRDRKPSSGAVLVFCKDTSTVNWLSYILDDHKIRHQRLQGQMEADTRAKIFKDFQKGEIDILVCTDIVSLGLDTIQVELVVNYDFPLTLHDYLHRVGRVGRLGSKFPGRVVSFVTHKWDVELVWKIETAARKRAPLPGMEPVLTEPV
ncbi:hypothetical protein JRQ81_006344 [Phrynocephalus forsythii]|uniref:RNA helicase n=1 Tax=Phrynocephalus forsythii TaxID=171643 RepID=A0A9Q1AU93_9SAUR|nr:hypothetical protein JRQ81_006344 [Phrynocephalus forsythii]